MKIVLILFLAVGSAVGAEWQTTDTNITAKLRTLYVHQYDREPGFDAWRFDPEAGGKVMFGPGWTNAPAKAEAEAVIADDPVVLPDALVEALWILSDKELAKELDKAKTSGADMGVILKRAKALKKVKSAAKSK